MQHLQRAVLPRGLRPGAGAGRGAGEGEGVAELARPLPQAGLSNPSTPHVRSYMSEVLAYTPHVRSFCVLYVARLLPFLLSLVTVCL